MKATLKKEEGLKREFEVIIPASSIAKKTEEELNAVSKKIKMPGFRPGKVPLAVVKQQHGDSIKADVLNKLIRESADQVFKDKNIQPCLEPDIKPAGTFEEGKDFKFTLECEIFPKVPEYDFTKLKITKPVAAVGKAEIAEGLEKISAGNTGYEPVKGRSKAQKGDIVKIDFIGRKDGVEFPGGKAEGFMLELGSGQFIPGFEDAVIGMEKGAEKTFPVTFPKEYHSKDMAGAKAEFSVTLQEINQTKKPEINDEFAKRFGFDTAAKLEEAVEGQIKSDFEEISFTKAKKSLFDELDAKHKFEVPQKMVDLDYDVVYRQMKQEDPNGKDADLQKEARKLAERRVRLGIILSELGKTEKIQVTNDEIRQLLFRKASAYPGQEQRVIEFYQKNAQAVEQLRGEILEDKVVKHLLTKVSLTEKKVTKDELLKEEDEDAGTAKPTKGGHVHGPDCNHGHGEEGHVHGPDCDHDDHGKKKTTTKKKK